MSTSGEESDQRKRSNKIDKELEEDSKKLRKECKILLLGMRPAPSLPPSPPTGVPRKAISPTNI